MRFGFAPLLFAGRRRSGARAFGLGGLLGAAVLTVSAAQLRIDLLGVPRGQLPPGFRSAVTGAGGPGDWQVVLADAPGAFAPLTDRARAIRQPVIAQLARVPLSEHFPLLIYTNEVFTDFTLRLKIKMVAGDTERMAGVAFRLQDENNYYVVRASSKGGTLRFYRVYRGVRGAPIGVNRAIPSGVWHDLQIQCAGNRIRITFDGEEAIPPLTDNTFREGRFALWTMADSVSYFSDIRLDYVPRVTLAETLVAELIKKYDRLLGLTLYAPAPDRPGLRVVASSDPARVGRPAGETAAKVIRDNVPYVARDKERKCIIATLPLHDRNGDPIAAVRVELRSFPGELDKNAVVRAAPIVKRMQRRVFSLEDLTR